MKRDITDRHPDNLDFALVSRAGCERCKAGAGEPHTYECGDIRIAEARQANKEATFIERYS